MQVKKRRPSSQEIRGKIKWEKNEKRRKKKKKKKKMPKRRSLAEKK